MATTNTKPNETTTTPPADDPPADTAVMDLSELIAGGFWKEAPANNTIAAYAGQSVLVTGIFVTARGSKQLRLTTERDGNVTVKAPAKMIGLFERAFARLDKGTAISVAVVANAKKGVRLEPTTKTGNATS